MENQHPKVRNLVFDNPRWRTAAILNFDFLAIISASINIFCTKFGTEMENQHPKVIHTLFRNHVFKKMQDGGRQPFLISNFGHNFGVNQHYPDGIQMENQQPKETHWSQIKFLKIHNLSHDFGVNQSNFCIIGHRYGK